MNNRCNKNKIVLVVLLFSIFVSLFSCDNTLENIENIENIVSKTIFIPEAANQYVIDKETEVQAVEETLPRHPYEPITLSADSDIVIGEKNFLTKIVHIYDNISKFTNTNVIVEGMYGWYTSWDETFQFPMVYRNGPGCCGNDQYGGFYLVNIDTNSLKIDDWIKVKGKPFMYEHKDSENEMQYFLFLLVEQLEIMTLEDRKAEMVNY